MADGDPGAGEPTSVEAVPLWEITDTVQTMSESKRRQLRDEMLAFCEFALGNDELGG